MLSFLRRIKKELHPFTDEARTLVFTPHRIIEGIVFHLVDAGRAKAVDLESSIHAERTLSARMEVFQINRREWELMNDAERLWWLIPQGHVKITLATEGSAVISVK